MGVVYLEGGPQETGWKGVDKREWRGGKSANYQAVTTMDNWSLISLGSSWTYSRTRPQSFIKWKGEVDYTLVLTSYWSWLLGGKAWILTSCLLCAGLDRWDHTLCEEEGESRSVWVTNSDTWDPCPHFPYQCRWLKKKIGEKKYC